MGGRRLYRDLLSVNMDDAAISPLACTGILFVSLRNIFSITDKLLSALFVINRLFLFFAVCDRKFEKKVAPGFMFEFHPFAEAHLTILKDWLKRDHIRPVWQEPEDESEFKEKFLNQLPQRSVYAFIIYFEHHP
ncbi:MAG: hypothetical protein K0R29_1849, partial [Pseudobdellovibrio sp.]|nr:hypothetical protein [Pseudobdellovibrio sp.]